MRRLFPKRGTSDGEPRVIVNLIVECQVVSSPEERMRILAEKKLCFNCTGTKHREVECNSKTMCQLCSKRHHTSICGEQPRRGMICLVFTTRKSFIQVSW